MLAVMLIGFAAGFQSGLLGVGGGVIMIPCMVFLLGMSQHQSHGTSLAVMPLLVGLGLTEYSRRGHVIWSVALALAAGGVIGAMFGARLAGGISGTRLRRMFGLFIMVSGAKMAVEVAPFVFGWHHAASSQAHLLTDPSFWTVLLMLPIGIITGLVSGLLGVGGGIVMIPVMVIFLGIPQKLAQGISLAVIVPVAISGALIHFSKGNVDLKIATWIGLGGLIGAYFGSLLANSLDASTLRFIFGAFLLVMSVLMLGRKEGKRQAGDTGPH